MRTAPHHTGKVRSLWRRTTSRTALYYKLVEGALVVAVLTPSLGKIHTFVVCVEPIFFFRCNHFDDHISRNTKFSDSLTALRRLQGRPDRLDGLDRLNRHRKIANGCLKYISSAVEVSSCS